MSRGAKSHSEPPCQVRRRSQYLVPGHLDQSALTLLDDPSGDRIVSLQQSLPAWEFMENLAGWNGCRVQGLHSAAGVSVAPASGRAPTG